MGGDTSLAANVQSEAAASSLSSASKRQASPQSAQRQQQQQSQSAAKRRRQSHPSAQKQQIEESQQAMFVRPNYIHHLNESQRRTAIFSCSMSCGAAANRNNEASQALNGAVASSPSAAVHRLATCGADHTIKLWSMTPILSAQAEAAGAGVYPRLLARLSQHVSSVNCIQFSPCGQYLASGGDGETPSLIVYRHDAQSHINTAFSQSNSNQHNNVPRDAHGFSSTSSSSAQSTAALESWPIHGHLNGHQSDIQDLCWSPDSTRIASASIDNTLRIWCVKTLRCLHVLAQHRGWVKGVAWDPLDRYLASQGDDSRVIIWSTQDWTAHHTITEALSGGGKASIERLPRVGVTALERQIVFCRIGWSPCGTFLAASGGSSRSQAISPIFERGTWKRAFAYTGHTQPTTVSRFSSRLFREIEGSGPNGARQIFSLCCVGSLDCSVTVWSSLVTRPLIHLDQWFEGAVLDCCWSTDDGMTLCCCSHDGHVACVRLTPQQINGAPLSAAEQDRLSRDQYSTILQSSHAQIAESPMMLQLKEQALQQQKAQQAAIAAATASKLNGIAHNAQQSAVAAAPVQPAKQKESRDANGRRRIVPMSNSTAHQSAIAAAQIAAAAAAAAAKPSHLSQLVHDLQQQQIRAQIIDVDDEKQNNGSEPQAQQQSQQLPQRTTSDDLPLAAIAAAANNSIAAGLSSVAMPPPAARASSGSGTNQSATAAASAQAAHNAARREKRRAAAAAEAAATSNSNHRADADDSQSRISDRKREKQQQLLLKAALQQHNQPLLQPPPVPASLLCTLPRTREAQLQSQTAMLMPPASNSNSAPALSTQQMQCEAIVDRSAQRTTVVARHSNSQLEWVTLLPASVTQLGANRCCIVAAATHITQPTPAVALPDADVEMTSVPAAPSIHTGSLFFLSRQSGRRVLPALTLPAAPVMLSCTHDSIIAILTADGTLLCYNTVGNNITETLRVNCESLLRPIVACQQQSLALAASAAGGKLSKSQLRQPLPVTLLAINAQGQPVIKLRDSSLYLWHSGCNTWLDMTEERSSNSSGDLALQSTTDSQPLQQLLRIEQQCTTALLLCDSTAYRSSLLDYVTKLAHLSQQAALTQSITHRDAAAASAASARYTHVEIAHLARCKLQELADQLIESAQSRHRHQESRVSASRALVAIQPANQSLASAAAPTSSLQPNSSFDPLLRVDVDCAALLRSLLPVIGLSPALGSLCEHIMTQLQSIEDLAALPSHDFSPRADRHEQHQYDDQEDLNMSTASAPLPFESLDRPVTASVPLASPDSQTAVSPRQRRTGRPQSPTKGHHQAVQPMQQ